MPALFNYSMPHKIAHTEALLRYGPKHGPCFGPCFGTEAVLRSVLRFVLRFRVRVHVRVKHRCRSSASVADNRSNASVLAIYARALAA